MKPLIGIPCWQDKLPQETRSRYTIYQTYVRAVAAAGAAPLIMPPIQDQDADQAIFERLDGILLAGGDDVNPARYGQVPHPKTEVPDDDRDELEINLVHWAIERRKPLMAICRGVQVVNVALGGTLIQDIQDLVPGALQHSYAYHSPELRRKPTQEIEIVAGSRLSDILGTHAAVNSFHHQGLAKLPDGFHAVACAADGIIEAIEPDDDRPIWAVQWHPEDMYETDESMLKLFKAFVAATQ